MDHYVDEKITTSLDLNLRTIREAIKSGNLNGTITGLYNTIPKELLQKYLNITGRRQEVKTMEQKKQFGPVKGVMIRNASLSSRTR